MVVLESRLFAATSGLSLLASLIISLIVAGVFTRADFDFTETKESILETDGTISSSSSSSSKLFDKLNNNGQIQELVEQQSKVFSSSSSTDLDDDNTSSSCNNNNEAGYSDLLSKTDLGGGSVGKRPEPQQMMASNWPNLNKLLNMTGKYQEHLKQQNQKSTNTNEDTPRILKGLGLGLGVVG